MKNFSSEIAVTRISDNKTPQGERCYSTNSIVEFSNWMSSAIEHFTAMVRFDSAVRSVAILARTYQDHHIISIDRDANGNVTVLSNR